MAGTSNGRQRAQSDAFSQFHPWVSFLYFALVLWFSMTLTHPVCQAESLLAGVLYALRLRRDHGLAFGVRYAAALISATAVLNPLFNHAGGTVLLYLPSGSALTLESILYGISSGTMLATLLIWFFCWNCVISSEKFMYLFGRILPSLSLLLRMTIRFIPNYQKQLKNVTEAQRSLGKKTEDCGIMQRMKNAAAAFSITITWALEHAVDTADSMKSRGYGQKKRTSFSLYRFGERDKMLAIWLGFCGIYVLFGQIAGGIFWRYLPRLQSAPATSFNISFYVVYLLLCLTPVIINAWEGRIWKKLQSIT